MDFEVLIVGSDVNAYYMARCCHEAYNKKAFMFIKDKLVFTTHSSIINKIYVPNLWDELVFVNKINDFLRDHSDKKVLVISSNETYAKYLVSNKSRFRDNIVFNYPSLDILESLINKEKFYKTYENSILSLPKTIYYRKGDKLDVSNFSFPLIVKPANVVLYNHIDFIGKKKIYKITDLNELNKVLSDIDLSEYDDTLIIQEFIPGDDSYLFDSVVYGDKDGSVKLISFAQIGLQEHRPSMVGNAAVLINSYNSFGVNTDKIISDIRNFMNNIGYTGFAEFDLKYDSRDGKFKVLEINARQGRCSYYVSAAGYNLVKILVDDLIFDKKMSFSVVDKKVMLSFVNKKIIKSYIQNSEFRKEALKLYKTSVNPLVYKEDKSILRKFYYFKRNKNYIKAYSNYKW